MEIHALIKYLSLFAALLHIVLCRNFKLSVGSLSMAYIVLFPWMAYDLPVFVVSGIHIALGFIATFLFVLSVCLLLKFFLGKKNQ